MSKEIINQIKEKGYWKVIIRPTKDFYLEKRFPTSDLNEIVLDNQVRLRGWYYPHFNSSGSSIVNENTVSNEYGDTDGYIEHWRFTESGQFVHLFAMKEDYMTDKLQKEKIKKDFRFHKEKGKNIEKFLEVETLIYRFTEIFLFAANLAQLKNNKDVGEFEVSVELMDVKDRMLFIWDWKRDLYEPYICDFDNNKITFSDHYKRDDLIANSNQYAVEKAIKIFKYFNWSDPKKQVISEMQSKLLERRF